MSEVISFWFRFGSQRVDDGVAEREALHPLGGPVGGHLADRHAPDLLGVGLEERAVEAPAEAGDEPALVVGLVLRRPDPGPRVRTPRSGPPRSGPRFCSAFGGLDRVVEVLPVVEDAALARAACRKSSSGRISCQRSSTACTLVKKRWPPMSNRQPSRSTVREIPPTVSPASRMVERNAVLVQLEGRGEPGGAGADDDDVVACGSVRGGFRGGRGFGRRVGPVIGHGFAYRPG